MTRKSSFGWFELVLGVLLVALGIYTFTNPSIALSGIVFIFSLLAILSGISDIVFYVRLRSLTEFGASISLISGIVSALAGLMLLLNPVIGKWILSIGFSIWFIAHSISRLANYRFIKEMASRGISILSLILSISGIILGVFMAFNSALSMISLGYLVATAIVIHGIGSIAEAFSGRVGGF
ncbi:DUF308 domain-containing protein [Eubacteriales bacterium OttesenSCG-928-K08]|nr:DUF308 domain-containing protein [Eubacteriales bacterium OttesenSCG-928-K08]